MQAIEKEKASIGAVIADLPTCDFIVNADILTETVKETLDGRMDMAGAIVMDGDEVLQVVSRDSLFRHLSKPFFRELYLRRPIRQFAKMWCGESLRLESSCTINRAAELALARPHEQVFEPILVDFGDRLGLIDAQALLVAQAQLLSLSRLVEEQRDAAEAANRSKSEFLANISHELRTPLHGILSYAKFGVNEAETADRSELCEFFRNVDHCAETLLHLVNDLLDLSKMEAGKMSFEFESSDMNAIVEAVIDEFRSLCAERALEIRYDGPAEAVVTMIDSTRFQQVRAESVEQRREIFAGDGHHSGSTSTNG